MSCVTLVAISGGGPRRHALLSQFERDPEVWSLDVARKAFGGCEGPVGGFEVRWSEAVDGEQLKTRKRLEYHAGDVLEALGLDEAQRDEFARLARKARPPERRVLGCLLANVRAMASASAERRAVVIEDNVRVLRSGAAEKCLAALATDADLVYVGHLAHEDTMRIVAAGREVPASRRGENHDLWGTYAYAPSRRFYEAVLDHLRTGFPSSIFSRESRRDATVRPADKLLNRVARDHFTVRVPPPCFFRMPPVLKSKIHTKWDLPFFQSTTIQLALYGLTWDAVWLTPEERDLALIIASEPSYY